MVTRKEFGAWIALAALLCVTGCGAASVAPPAPAPPPSVLVQRDRAQAGIVAATGIQSAALLAAIADSLEYPVAHPSGCRNGVKATIMPSPDGVLETLDLYYESSCAHRLVHAELNTLQFVPGRVVIATIFETHALGGRTVAYGKSISTTYFTKQGSRSTMTGSVSLSRNGAPIERFGLTCTLGKGGTCGFGAVTNAPALHTSLGFTATIGGFTGHAAGGGSISVRSYQGEFGTLSIAPGPRDSWIVKGGTMLARQRGTYRERAITSALVSSCSLSLIDASGTRVDLASDARTGVSGSISSGSFDARLSVGADGNGRIDYAGGAGDLIGAFVIGS